MKVNYKKSLAAYNRLVGKLQKAAPEAPIKELAEKLRKADGSTELTEIYREDLALCPGPGSPGYSIKRQFESAQHFLKAFVKR